MATLVLTTVGTALGGPLGGALGALIGQSVDNSLFAPRREGPRLDTLAVQSSRYGTHLPLLFGHTRTAGSVIWATDLHERRSTRGGKGKPKVTSYAYSADFAVALSARPVRRIVRVWADGTLLTRADGSLDVDGAMRLHRCDEDQRPDPLIEAEEGRGRTPSYRGLAYVVFEGLALESFGNRIPMLSFEVEADEEPLAFGPMVDRLSDGRLSIEEIGVPAVGAAFAGFSRRDALFALAEPLGLGVRAEEGGLRLSASSDRPIVSLHPTSLGARRAGEEGRTVALADRPAPTSVAVTFAEPARDHQPGRQRAAIGGGDERPVERSLPLVLDAADAKALATVWLDRAQATARRATVTTTLAAGLTVAPGERVRLPDTPGLWRVTDWLLESMVVRLELEPVVDASPMVMEADGGRPVPALPPTAGTVSRVELFELPYLTDGDGPILFAAVERERSRPVPLLLRSPTATEPIGLSAPPAVMGTMIEPPGPANPLLFDRRSVCVVALPSGADLADADATSLSAGANAALVGDEVLQWSRAEPLGDGRWRLSGFLRGRRGTQAAVGRARPGDRFVSLDPDTVQPIPTAIVGAPVTVIAEPGGGDGAVASEPLVPSAGARPLSPVHLRARAQGDGGVTLSWVRRSRSGWRWVDGADAPLGEERESYVVTLGDGRTVETDVPRLSLSAVERAFAFTVQQRGTHGLSAPAHSGDTQ